MSHDQLTIQLGDIRRAVEEQGALGAWWPHSGPLWPLHRMIRALAGMPTSPTGNAVDYRRGCAEPHRLQLHRHWAVVGIDWPGLHTPDPSLAWRSDAPPAQRLIVIRQSVPAPVTLHEVANARNEEYRAWLLSQCLATRAKPEAALTEEKQNG